MVRSMSVCGLVLIVLVSSASVTALHILPEHMSVNIINDFSTEIAWTPIVVHCKSRTSDLGAQTIEPKGKYGFGFKPNVWGSTKYWCEFSVKTPVGFVTSTHWLTVWQDDSYMYLQKRLCEQCFYSVRRDGIYRAEAGGVYTHIYLWP